MRALNKMLSLGALLSACSGASRTIAPITLEPMATIGAAEGSGTMATWPRVSAHHPGGFRVLVPQPGGMAALPLAYADDGGLLGPMGASGDSTGGFREPLFTRIGPGDSLWIFDNAQRVLVFGPNRRWARTVQLPVGPWDAQVGADGRMLIAASASDRPLPLLQLSAVGVVEREFAADSISQSIHSPRRLIHAPDGSWWTMPMQFRYRLEHWDTSGALLGVLERRPEWFQSYRTSLAPSREQAPSPMLMDAWFDSAGRLWVLGKAADPNWSAGLTPPNAHGTDPAIGDADKVYDTVIEVLDPATGALLAATRFDVSYPFAVEPGVVMRVRTTADGWNQAELMRVVLDTARLGKVAGGVKQ